MTMDTGAMTSYGGPLVNICVSPFPICNDVRVWDRRDGWRDLETALVAKYG
jgi:hypothetical protein